jgi:two-component system LytT family sensor kinase
MLQRGEPSLPSFWHLQTIGWASFYALVLVASAPRLGEPGELKNSTITVGFMFLSSLLLRLVCRSLLRQSFSWIARELQAFGWCLLTALVAACLAVPLINSTIRTFNWAEWRITSVQFTVVLFLWSSLFLSIKQWHHSEQERERLLRAETEVRDARLSALRYQLNPHFLFNSLNAVSTLVLEGYAEAASRMLSQISEFLRSTLDTELAAELPLSQEVVLAERYLAIEQTRLGDRLQVKLEIAHDTLDALVPSLFLQPLVENAVRHGIAPQLEGGAITIYAQRHGSRLQVKVSNSGSPANGTAQSIAKGIGLTNTGERLKTLYGAGHSFALHWPDTGGCEVTLDLPFKACEHVTGAAAACVS